MKEVLLQASRQLARITLALCLAPSAFAADNGGSLYDQSTYKPLIAEDKAYKVGDVLTVVIQETTTASTTADSKSERNTGFSAQATTSRTNPVSAGLKAGGSSDGGGRTQRSGRLLATVSVRVIEVLSNGDLSVQGNQLVNINGEQQSIQLSGVVRPRDIAENNSVPSTRIADARINLDGEGFISERSKPGWLSRFFSFIGF